MRHSLIVSIIAILFGSLLSACQDDSSTRVGQRTQEGVMKRAQASVAVPQTRNFLTRKTVAKWLKRQDVADRPYYVYVMSMTGQPIGYFVAQSRPVNICTFMTPPEREYHVSRGQGSNPLGTAPALDGVYYKGGGCNQWYFFDAETDAMVEITTDVFGIFSTDQPLAIDVDPIRVQTSASR